MPQLEISRRALIDIDQIYDYIGIQNHSRQAANKFVRELNKKMAAYSRQPELGEMRDDLNEGLRSFPFKKNYVVIYRPLEDGIDVLRIFHGARNYGQFFEE